MRLIVLSLFFTSLFSFSEEIGDRDAFVRSIRHSQFTPELGQKILGYLRTVTLSDHPLLVEVAVDYVIYMQPSGYKDVLIDLLEGRIVVGRLTDGAERYGKGVRATIIEHLPELLSREDIRILAGIQRGWGRSTSAVKDSDAFIGHHLFGDFVKKHNLTKDHLIGYLGDPDYGLRALAVYALSKEEFRSDKSVILALKEVLETDNDPFVRMAVLDNPVFNQNEYSESKLRGLLPIADMSLKPVGACEARAYNLLVVKAFQEISEIHRDPLPLLTSYPRNVLDSLKEWARVDAGKETVKGTCFQVLKKKN